MGNNHSRIMNFPTKNLFKLYLYYGGIQSYDSFFW